jgi:hypothetical protein
MQFLYPIGLFALLGILVPVLIHLWNVKQRKTLKIGSIAFFGESASRSSRSFKIADWLLLLLRCLLIFMIALLLAAPYLIKKLTASDKGWVLVEKDQFQNLNVAQQKEIDSLLKNGFELHDFNLGFAAWQLKDTVSKEEIKPSKLTYNALIKQLNTQLPAGFKVYLYAQNSLTRYDGKIANSPLAIQFRTYATPDSLISKVVGAYYTNSDSLRAILMNSSPKETNYSYQNITNETKNITLRIDSGLSFLKTREQSNWIKADTTTLHIAIYEEQNQNDAAYLKSAILAIRDFSGRKISLHQLQNSTYFSSQIAMLFWLSEKPIPENISNKNGLILFSYEAGKEQSLSSSLQIKNGTVTSIIGSDLYKRVSNESKEGDAIWTDGFGKGILTYTQKEENDHYHFYSRFNPQWTDLVWNEAFVKAMVPIVLAKPNELAHFGFEQDSADQRILSQKEIFASNNTSKLAGIAVNVQNPMSNWLWILAFLIFLAERILSFNQKKA